MGHRSLSEPFRVFPRPGLPYNAAVPAPRARVPPVWAVDQSRCSTRVQRLSKHLRSFAAEPSIEQIEAEFWRIVESPEQPVESLYGQVRLCCACAGCCRQAPRPCPKQQPSCRRLAVADKPIFPACAARSDRTWTAGTTARGSRCPCGAAACWSATCRGRRTRRATRRRMCGCQTTLMVGSIGLRFI